jgi:hypothetical protein
MEESTYSKLGLRHSRAIIFDLKQYCRSFFFGANEEDVDLDARRAFESIIREVYENLLEAITISFDRGWQFVMN